MCVSLHVYKYIACMCALGGQQRALVAWNWNYKWVWTAMSVLGTEPGSTAGAASLLNWWAMSSAPLIVLHSFRLHIRNIHPRNTSWLYPIVNPNKQTISPVDSPLLFVFLFARSNMKGFFISSLVFKNTTAAIHLFWRVCKSIYVSIDRSFNISWSLPLA